MCKRSFLLATIFALHSGAVAGQGLGARTREVLAVEDRRFAAMTDADTATLRRYLSDSLTYTHTTGRLDGKSSLLRALASGALRYEVISPDSRAVRFEGPLALVVGRSSMRAGAPGNLQDFQIRYLAVYTRRAGAWQLLAWHATRLPETPR